ncbi:Paraquat-inducible protein A [compost metagenome]
MMQSLRPWGMIEVFLLGVLVAIVKLSSMATVVPGPALWAFVALTVTLTAVLSFNPGAFWEMTFRKADEEDANAEADPPEVRA